MRDWQERYLRNVREVAEIRQLFGNEEPDFDTWYARHLETEKRLSELKAENTALLSDCLFPVLDSLPEANEETIADLDAFSDQLMDWKTNLDCGVYVAIHDALLSLNRLRRNRDGIIRELYKLGMGLYYLHRSVNGIYCKEVDSMHFQNEMVFTEAASYFRYFQAIDNDETKGFVLRSMANISICSNNYKRRINASIKTIRTVSDPDYRAMAPTLPWDTYLKRSHQQLSSCRSQLSDGDITQLEIAAVMDSCYEVFKPEQQSANPSARWLWPFYEMEYHCGYVSVELTAERIEKIIRETPLKTYDIDELYGNVQLPIYFGRMIGDHEQLRNDPRQLTLLAGAYQKMMHALMTIPPEMCGDYFRYVLILVVTDFYEIENSFSYRELTERLMERFAGRLYLKSLKAGELLSCFCTHIFRKDPAFFARLSLDENGGGEDDRLKTLQRFASEIGLYHDFGLFKMGLERPMLTRNLFENEDAIYRLHVVSGYADLRGRKSTEKFADTARGHHSPYAGSSDDISGYVRMDSPYRQMTDLMAIISDLQEHGQEDIQQWSRRIRIQEKNRFSPRAAAYLADETLLAALDGIRNSDDRDRCRIAFDYYYMRGENKPL